MVTTTSTAPAAWAGVVAVMEVALPTVIPVAAAPPKVTEAPDTKPVPVIVVALTTVTPVAAVPPKVTVAPLTKSGPVMVTEQGGSREVRRLSKHPRCVTACKDA